jgi:PAS domain S-box-containing protein
MMQATKTEYRPLSEDSRALQEAFRQFSLTSATLEVSYRELQLEARRLSVELAAANADLQRTLAEKERVKNYLRNILDSLTNGVLVVDESRNIQTCNPAAVRLLDLDADACCKALDSVALPLELRRWMELAIGTEGSTEDMELQMESNAGSRHMIVASSPLPGNNAGRSGTAFIFRDVTRLKELELKTQRDQRLRAMGEMAVELAHEVRNPLGSIELFASLLGGELQDKPQLKGWADQVVTSVKCLNTIVTNMLTFTRASQPHFRTIDLTAVVDETLSFMGPVFEQRRIRMEAPEDRTPIPVEGDPEMLRQLLINLMMNAMQAMPEQGRLSLRVVRQALSIQIEVEDTGIGIPAENLARIFDPFFTTSEKGTGLGLAIAHQIVVRHNGSIKASSEFGKGTLFTISLPVSANGFDAC